MGMFDWVNFKMPCPECGAEMTGFQTKDTDCSMAEVEPDATNNFYSGCEHCGAWVEISRNQARDKPKREVPLTLQEVEAMGFEVQLTPSTARPWAKKKAKQQFAAS